MNTNRQQLLEQLSEIENQQYQTDTWSDEGKSLARKRRAVVVKIRKSAPELQPGETFSIEDVAAKLYWTGKGSPRERWMKENGEGYRNWQAEVYVEEKDVEKLTEIVGHNEGLWNYFSKETNPHNIKIEEIGRVQDKVESNSIYAKMCAKTITTFKGTFELFVKYQKEPITVERTWSKNTTLSQSDVRAFM